MTSVVPQPRFGCAAGCFWRLNVWGCPKRRWYLCWKSSTMGAMPTLLPQPPDPSEAIPAPSPVMAAFLMRALANIQFHDDLVCLDHYGGYAVSQKIRIRGDGTGRDTPQGGAYNARYYGGR